MRCLWHARRRRRPDVRRLENRIARIAYGIPAVKGVEFGAGFGAAALLGSQNNDPYRIEDERVVCEKNDAGGILGGISTGMPIVWRAAVKPTPSIGKRQDSVDLGSTSDADLVVHGRHDPCIVPRAVPVVEAACALALLDALVDDRGAPHASPSPALVSRHLTRITSNTVWSTMADLTEIRTRIDAIDTQICDLFAQRMQCTHEVAEYKRESGKPILDRGRERAKLADVATKVPEKLRDYSQVLFSLIMEISRSEQSAELNHESELAGDIRTAIGGTPALFPQDAFVACPGCRGGLLAACGRPPVQASQDKLLRLVGGRVSRRRRGLLQLWRAARRELHGRHRQPGL